MSTPSRCGRCGTPLTSGQTGSFFDTSLVCFDCDDIERAHPDWQYARDAEVAACRRGDYNFPGVGVPVDLVPMCVTARKAREESDRMPI